MGADEANAKAAAVVCLASRQEHKVKARSLNGMKQTHMCCTKLVNISPEIRARCILAACFWRVYFGMEKQ